TPLALKRQLGTQRLLHPTQQTFLGRPREARSKFGFTVVGDGKRAVSGSGITERNAGWPLANLPARSGQGRRSPVQELGRLVERTERQAGLGKGFAGAFL